MAAFVRSVTVLSIFSVIPGSLPCILSNYNCAVLPFVALYKTAV